MKQRDSFVAKTSWQSTVKCSFERYRVHRKVDDLLNFPDFDGKSNEAANPVKIKLFKMGNL